MGATKGDIVVAVLKATFGPIPWVGTALGEIAGLLTPNQKIHILERRLDELANILEHRTSAASDIPRSSLHSDEFWRLTSVIGRAECDFNAVIDDLTKEQFGEYTKFDQREKHDFLNRFLSNTSRISLPAETIEKIIEFASEELANSTPELQSTLETPGGGFHNLGVLLSTTGRHYEAIAAYMKAIQFGCADECVCLINVANRFRALGLIDIAVRGYELVLFRFPFALSPHIYLAEIALSKGNHSLAQTHYQRYTSEFDKRLSEGAQFPAQPLQWRRQAEGFLAQPSNEAVNTDAA